MRCVNRACYSMQGEQLVVYSSERNWSLNVRYCKVIANSELTKVIAIIIEPKPSLKIRTVNKAGLFDIEARSVLAYLIFF